MCHKVTFTHNNKESSTQFKSKTSQLPIGLNNNKTMLVKWGRRKTEDGNLPISGWASLKSIESGKWDMYFPMSIKLMLSDFSVKNNVTKKYDKFSVVYGNFIQGLLARDGDEFRVYVVTIAPDNKDHICWPRILVDNN